MAKIVRIAQNVSGATFNNVPGSDASLSRESNQVDDSVFGNDFSSSQPALIDWSIQHNAYYKGISGYLATVKKQGTSTVMTDEAMTAVSGNTVFEIDAGTKSLWDKDTAIVFVDTGLSGIIASSDIVSIDYLFGRVTFATAKATGSGDIIQVTGNYFPLSALGSAQDFSLKQTADSVDTTDFATAQANGGFRTYRSTLLKASLDIGQFFDVASGFFDELTARNTLIIEINPDGTALSASVPISTTGESRARGYFKIVSQGQEGNVGGDEQESISFELSVPETPAANPEAIAKPFGWIHGADSTLNQSLQDLLTGWQEKTEVQVEYLPDGTSGSGTGSLGGNAVVTEISISGDVNGINEFSSTLQGTGALTAV